MDKLIKPAIGAFILCLLLTLSNCTYKNAQDVYPVNLSYCSTANMSYANDIYPILKANCYACHDSVTSLLGKGYRLDSYAAVVAQVDPYSGDILYGNISSPPTYIKHMPNNGTSLSPCEIVKIKAWIDQGYKNN